MDYFWLQNPNMSLNKTDKSKESPFLNSHPWAASVSNAAARKGAPSPGSGRASRPSSCARSARQPRGRTSRRPHRPEQDQRRSPPLPARCFLLLGPKRARQTWTSGSGPVKRTEKPSKSKSCRKLWIQWYPKDLLQQIKDDTAMTANIYRWRKFTFSYKTNYMHNTFFDAYTQFRAVMLIRTLSIDNREELPTFDLTLIFTF